MTAGGLTTVACPAVGFIMLTFVARSGSACHIKCKELTLTAVRLGAVLGTGIITAALVVSAVSLIVWLPSRRLSVWDQMLW